MELFDVLKAKAGIPVEDAMAVLFAKRKKSKEKLMPFDNGITNFYDCKKGVTASAWKNQASARNDAVLTGATVTQDGALQVSGTSSSYGYFDAAVDGASSVCIYAVFKAPKVGQINENRHIVGSCFGSVSSYTAGAWLTAAIDGYDAADTLGADLWGMGCGSSITCEDYHVVTVNKQFHQGTYNEYKVNLYIDGVFIAETSTFYVGSGTKFGIGAVRDGDNAFAYNSSSMPVQIKMLAVGSEIHSAAQIAQNVAYLRQYYGLTATISGIPPLTFKAFGEYLTDYLISGNTIQNGTPTPSDPVNVTGCGEWDTTAQQYKIPVTCGGTTSDIFLGQTTRRIRKLVLTGNETIASETETTTPGLYCFAFRYSDIGMENIINYNSDMALCPYPEFVCTHFRMKHGSPTVPDSFKDIADGEIGGNSVRSLEETTRSYNYFLILCASGYSTISSFKQYLAAQYAAGTPVTIWYALATPETVAVNEPLMKVGDYADTISMTQAGVSIPTTAGTNTLTVGTTVQPSNMAITGEIWTDTGA